MERRQALQAVCVMPDACCTAFACHPAAPPPTLFPASHVPDAATICSLTPCHAGETQEVIAARKLQFPWGRWLKEGGGEEDEEEEEQEQEAGGSEASAQTGGGKAGCSHHHNRSKGSSLSDDVDKEADKDQVGRREGGTSTIAGSADSRPQC